MNEITGLIEIIQNAGFIGLLIVLAIPKLRRSIFGTNGNGSSKELKDIKENHLHDIANKLDTLIETQRKGNEDVRKVLFIIERKNGK